MKLIKNTSLLLLLFSITIIQTKQTGAKSVYTSETPMQPKTPIIRPQQIPIILEGPRYTEILFILKSKTPDSSDFSTLNDIKHEAEFQINLIQERKPDLRARRWRIRSAADIETYSDILTALKQKSPDSSDLSTLRNIITEVDHQLQSIQNRGKKPTIQPFQPIVPKGPTYTEILRLLKDNNPDSSDFQTLQDIIYEAERQMEVIKTSVRKPNMQREIK